MLDNVKKKWDIQSDFNKSVLTLFSGTTLAQVIPLIISPILTRIYSPQDFGIYGLFMAISMIIGSLSSGKFEFAIILPKDEEKAINILGLSILLSLIISIIIFIIILIFHDIIIESLKDEKLSIWLYYVPIASFLISLFNILNYFKIRLKDFKEISYVKIVRSIILGLVQLLFGLKFAGSTGLVFGNISSNVTANLLLCRNLMSKRILMIISYDEIKNQSKRYMRFPKYSLPGELCNTFSLNLINIIITTLFSTTVLGFYSLINRVLILPLNLLGNSVSQVYYNEAVSEKLNSGNNFNILLDTLKKLVFISIPIFIFLYLFIDDLIPLIFGNDWSIAGGYARILLPLFAIRFIISPITITLNVFEKQRLFFFWQFGYLLSVCLVFYISYQFSFSIEYFLHLYTWNAIIQYLIILFIIFKISLRKLS